MLRSFHHQLHCFQSEPVSDTVSDKRFLPKELRGRASFEIKANPGISQPSLRVLGLLFPSFFTTRMIGHLVQQLKSTSMTTQPEQEENLRIFSNMSYLSLPTRSSFPFVLFHCNKWVGSNKKLDFHFHVKKA